MYVKEHTTGISGLREVRELQRELQRTVFLARFSLAEILALADTAGAGGMALLD